MQLTEEVGIKTGGGDEMSHHSNVLYHRICCDLLGHIMSSPLTASVQISEPPDVLMHCTVNIQTPQTQVSHHSKHSKVLFQYLTPFYDTYNKNKNKIQLGLLQPWNFSLSLSPSSSWLVGPHCEFHHLVSVWIFLLRHRWTSLRDDKTCALRSDVHSDVIWGSSLGIRVVHGPRV